MIAFFGGAGEAMLAVVRFVIALSPIGVFALMLPVTSRTSLAAAGALGYYVVVRQRDLELVQCCPAEIRLRYSGWCG